MFPTFVPQIKQWLDEGEAMDGNLVGSTGPDGRRVMIKILQVWGPVHQRWVSCIHVSLDQLTNIGSAPSVESLPPHPAVQWGERALAKEGCKGPEGSARPKIAQRAIWCTGLNILAFQLFSFWLSSILLNNPWVVIHSVVGNSQPSHQKRHRSPSLPTPLATSQHQSESPPRPAPPSLMTGGCTALSLV